MDDFYVTLPSSVKSSQFENTSSRYVTRLPEVLSLDSEREKYSVAVTDIIYPHSFLNVGRPLDYWIHFKPHLNRPPVHVTFPADQYSSVAQVVDALNEIKTVPGSSRKKRSAVEALLDDEVSRAKRSIVDEFEKANGTSVVEQYEKGKKDQDTDAKLVMEIDKMFSQQGTPTIVQQYNKGKGEVNKNEDEAKKIDKIISEHGIADEYEEAKKNEEKSIEKAKDIGKEVENAINVTNVDIEMTDNLFKGSAESTVSQYNEAKKQQDEAKKKQDEADVKKKKDEEDEKKKKKDEADAKKKQEEAKKKQEEAKKKQDDAEKKQADDKKKQDEADAKRRKDEADAKRRKDEADAKKRQDDAKKQKDEADAKKRKDEADAKKKQDDAKKRKDEADAKKRQDEADAKKRQDEADAKKRQDDAKKRKDEADAAKVNNPDPIVKEIDAMFDSIPKEYDSLPTIEQEYANAAKQTESASVGWQRAKEQSSANALYWPMYKDAVSQLLNKPLNQTAYDELKRNLLKTRSKIYIEEANNARSFLMFRENLDRIHVDVLTPQDVAFVEFEPSCGYFLGFHDNIVYTSGTAPSKVDFFGNVSTIYLYCDVVAPIIVGDQKNSLLAVIPCSGKYGEMIHHIVPQPRYLPLMNYNIDSIKIELLSEFAEPIRFHWGSTIIVLHFKKR